MNHAFGILAVDDTVVFGVEPLQFLAESFEAFLLQAPLHGSACLVVDGGDVVDAVADSVDIHHTASSHQGVVAVAEKLLQQFEYLLFKERCAVIIIEAERSHEIVSYLLHLLVSRPCRTDAQFLVDLPGVSVDDRDAEVPGNIEAEAGLADGSGPCDDYQRLIRKLSTT